MLINDTYNDRQARRLLKEQVGNKFSIIQRIRMGGIGSQRLRVIAASDEIKGLLRFDNKRDVCNIEMRKGGIVLRFQSKMYSYAWPIPWHQLTLFRNGEVLSIYGPNKFVKVVTEHNEQLSREFVIKVLMHKANATGLNPMAEA